MQSYDKVSRVVLLVQGLQLSLVHLASPPRLGEELLDLFCRGRDLQLLEHTLQVLFPDTLFRGE